MLLFIQVSNALCIIFQNLDLNRLSLYERIDVDMSCSPPISLTYVLSKFSILSVSLMGRK